MRFFIYSSTNEQARRLARIMDLARNEWTFIHSPEVLYGQRHGVILLYGTWQELPKETTERVRDRAYMNMMPVLLIEEKGL